MGGSPLVSVVIPVHNRAKLVLASIRSVLSQEGVEVEVVVVDDGSGDRSSEVVLEIGDPRIRLYRHEKSKGACAARNTGLTHATGQFVTFLDSDDEYLPGKLARQVNSLVSVDPGDAAVCICAFLRRNQVGQDRMIRLGDVTRIQELLLAHRFPSVATNCIMLRRMEATENVRFDEALPAYQDWDFLFRLADVSVVVGLPETLCVAYEHSGKRITTACRQRDALVILEEKYRSLIEVDEEIASYWAFRIARLSHKCGDLEQAVVSLQRSLAIRPWNWKRKLLLSARVLGSSAFDRAFQAYYGLGTLKRMLR